MNERLESSPRWLGRTLFLMRWHFLVIGLLLVLSAVGFAGYLYWLEFRRIDVGWSLRIERPRDIYEAGMQLQTPLIVFLALAGLILLHAANRARLWGVRLAAVLLLVASGGAAVFLWWLASNPPEAGSSVIGDAVRNVPWAVRAVAVVLFGQFVLTLWYGIASFARVVRDQRAEPGTTLYHLMVAGVVLAVLLVIGLGVTLGIVTDELYEWPIDQPDPGELLYATMFDDFNDEWDIFTGRDAAETVPADQLGLTTGAGAYHPVDGSALAVTYSAVESQKVLWSTLNRKFRDMDFRVTTQRVSGPLDNQLGVMFRYQDEEHFLLFRISSDGYYSLEKVQGDSQETISEWGLSDIVRQENAANTIRIVARGDTFWFFINGQPAPLCLKGEYENSDWNLFEPGVCDTSEPTYVYHDDTFRQGRIALAAGSSSDLSAPVVIAFDDVLIVGPEPE